MNTADSETYGRTATGDLDPDRLAYDIERFGTDYADKRHAFSLLKNTRSALLAELTNRCRAESPSLSRREAEDIARATQDYRSHLYAMSDAERAANLARARFEAARARFEAIRSAEATRRKQMGW